MAKDENLIQRWKSAHELRRLADYAAAAPEEQKRMKAEHKAKAKSRASTPKSAKTAT